MPRAARNLWTKYEDNAIIELVAVHGPKAWASVVKELVLLKPPVLRTGKQCRERYHNHLDPAVDKSPWTDLETAKLRDLQGVHGNKWAVIALELPGRTDNAIKNQWYSIARSDNKPPRKKRQPKPKAEWEKREKEKGKGKGKRKVKKRCGTADEAKKKKKKKKKNLKKSKKRKVKKRKRGAVNAQIAPSVELLPPNKRSRRNAQLSISPADVDGGPNSAGLQHDQALLGHVDTTPTSRSFLDQAHSAAMSASAAGIDSGALFGVAVGAMHAAASGGSARYRWMTSNNVQENPMRTQAALREMTASNRGGGDSSQVTPPFQGDCGSLSARSLSYRHSRSPSPADVTAFSNLAGSLGSVSQVLTSPPSSASSAASATSVTTRQQAAAAAASAAAAAAAVGGGGGVFGTVAYNAAATAAGVQEGPRHFTFSSDHVNSKSRKPTAIAQLKEV